MLALRARQLAVYLCIWAHAIDATNYHLCTEEFHLSFLLFISSCALCYLRI